MKLTSEEQSRWDELRKQIAEKRYFSLNPAEKSEYKTLKMKLYQNKLPSEEPSEEPSGEPSEEPSQKIPTEPVGRSREDQMVDLLTTMVSKLDNLNTRVERIEQDAPQTKTLSESIESTNKEPVPRELQEVVVMVLGSEFGVETKSIAGSNFFEFTIVVPNKYAVDILPDMKAHKEMPGFQDSRNKVINVMSAIADARRWAMRVRDNIFKGYQKQSLPSPFQAAVV